MAKKICCVALICVILGCNFCLTAYAADSMVWDFLFSWLYDTYTNIDGYGDIADDPDALIDYYSTDDGRRAYDLMTNFDGALPGLLKYVTVNDLDEAVAGRYMAAQLKRDHVNALYDQLNGYWSDNNASVRNVSLSDIDIDLAADTVVHGSWGYLTGAGPAMLKGSYSNDNNYVTMYHMPDGYDNYTLFNSSNGHHVYVYNGSIYYPPMIYITSGSATQNGVTLPSGLYCVLNSTELWYVGMGAQRFNNVYYFYSGSDDNLHVYVKSRYDNTNVTSKVGMVYINGVGYEPGYSDYDAYTVMDKFTKAVGMHIITDDTVEPKSITVPEDIPYDDDGSVIVLVPVDQPGAPVYMSPTVYNNYYNNGDIVDSHDTTNNYFTDDQIQQIINNYNNYKSEYDDSKILGKLNTIIDKLDDIYNAVKDLGRLDEVLDAVPVYDDFSDCITTNVPLIADVQNLVEAMRVDEASSGFDTSFFVVSDGMHPSGVSSGYDNLIPALYDGFSPNVGWYAPYRNDIRNLLKLFCYAGGIVAVWYAVRSVFGVHGGGDDG